MEKIRCDILNDPSPARSPLVAYALASIAILCWAGNFIVGRVANLELPPISLSFWRHVLAALMVLPFFLPALKKDWPLVKQNTGMFLLLSFLFVAGNTLVYFCVLHTAVINAALINAGVPVVVAFFSWLILRQLVNRWQGLGILISFIGIAIVVTRSDLATLQAFDFRLGDLFMLLAVISWAVYMVLFRRAAIQISPWTLLFVLCAMGAVWLIPAYAVEIAMGYRSTVSFASIGAIVYVALFSTILAWACWNASVMQIGPNRTAAFMNLHPVFGAALAIPLLGETLQHYHFSGTALVLIGVFLVSRTWKDGA